MKIEQMSYRREIVKDMPFEIGIVLCNRFGQKAYKKLLDRLEQRCLTLDNVEKIANTQNLTGLNMVKERFLYTKRSRLKTFSAMPVFNSFIWGFVTRGNESVYSEEDFYYWSKLVKIVQKDCERLRKTYEHLHKTRRVCNRKRELTIRELFMFNAPQKLIQFLIEEKVLDEFIKNLKKNQEIRPFSEAVLKIRITDASIVNMFFWDETKEGCNFWKNLLIKYNSKK